MTTKTSALARTRKFSATLNDRSRAALALAFSLILLGTPRRAAAGCQTWQTPDLNGYCAGSEVFIGTAPGCDVTLTPADSLGKVQSAVDNPAYRVICFAPGDYRALGRIVIHASGDSGNPRWIRLAGTERTHPYRLPVGSRAVLASVRLAGASHWVIYRLSFDGGGSSQLDAVYLGEWQRSDLMVSDVVLDSVEITGYRADGVTGFCFSDSTIQNSTVHDMVTNPDFEANGIELVGDGAACGVNDHVVNNEVWNAHKQIGSGSGNPSTAGAIIENNDIYLTPDFYTDCNGNPDVQGACSRAEGMLALKSGGVAGNPVRLLHNRIWGGRRGDGNIVGQDSCCHNYAIALSSDGGPGARYVETLGNVIAEAQHGLSGWWEATPDGHNSYIGNLIYKVHSDGEGGDGLFIRGKPFSEVYLNTVVDADSQWFGLDWFNNQSIDVRCNVAIASAAANVAEGSGLTVDRNVFYGTPPYTFGATGTNLSFRIVSWSGGAVVQTGDHLRSAAAGKIMRAIQGGTTGASEPPWPALGSTTQDGSVVWQVVRAPFTFARRRLTGPDTYSIPYARPDASAAEARWCPGNVSSDAPGAQPGLGIDEEVATWPAASSGLFAVDLAGASRAGTAGALEASGQAGSGPGDLIARWPFDEGSGTTAGDVTGNRHGGVLVNGPTWTSGRFGSGLLFDGSDDYVALPGAVIGDAAAFTLAGWFQISSSQKGVLYGEFNSGTTPVNPMAFVYVSINENFIGDAEFGVLDAAGNWGGISLPASNLNDGKWHHLACVQRTKSDRELFIDGVSRGQSSIPVGTMTMDRAELGKFDVSSTLNLLEGGLDDFRIYDRALSAPEVQSVMNGN